MCGRLDILAESLESGCKGCSFIPQYLASRLLDPYIWTVSHSYYVIVHQIAPMDTLQLSRKRSFSGSFLTLPTAQQESRAFQPSVPVSTNGRPSRTEHSDWTTVVENRNSRRHSRLLWSLPQKGSNQNPSLGSVGGQEPSNTRAFSGVYSTKRLKSPITPPLSSPVALCKPVAPSGLSRPLLNIFEAKTQSQEQVDSAEATDDLLRIGHPKGLQSPFEYTQDPITRRINQSAKDGIQRIDHDEPLYRESSSRYFYFAPTNPSDKTNQALNAPHMVPRRQLLYVDPTSKPRPRSLHKSTGSWELRHEAKRHAEDCNILPRSDSTLIARPYHSEPIRSKPRPRLDLSEQKDEIKKAVSISKFTRCRDSHGPY